MEQGSTEEFQAQRLEEVANALSTRHAFKVGDLVRMKAALCQDDAYELVSEQQDEMPEGLLDKGPAVVTHIEDQGQGNNLLSPLYLTVMFFRKTDKGKRLGWRSLNAALFEPYPGRTPHGA